MYRTKRTVTLTEPLINLARARQALQPVALRLAESHSVSGGVH